MKLTFEDTEIIRKFEGHSLKTYLDGGGVPTVSYGLTGPNIKMGMTITEEESKKMFMERIDSFCLEIDKLIKTTINKNQYIALLSLCYNIGIGAFKKSTLLKYLNQSKFKEAGEQFLVWCKDNGKTIKGLLNRRIKEKELFLK